MVTAPEVKQMNDTQWLCELEGLYMLEEERYEEIKLLSKLTKKALVDLLGLNLMPVEEEIPIEERDVEYVGAIGEEKVYRKLRQPEEHEVIPLSILMGREEIVAEIIKRQKELHDQEELDEKEAKGDLVHMSPEELDKFMEGDMVFPDDPKEAQRKMIWESEEFQANVAAMVKPMSEKDKDDIILGKDGPVVRNPRGPKVPTRSKSRVTLE